VDLPAIGVSGGPMLSGKYRGTDIGSGTNAWSMSEDLRAGKITLSEFHEADSCMNRSHGHCMTMGTASTMASMAEALGVGVHCLVNLMPSGKFLMEDFYYAGGLPAVIRELGANGLLHKDARTVNGKSLWENNKSAPCWNRDVIFQLKKPFKKNSGIAVLRG